MWSYISRSWSQLRSRSCEKNRRLRSQSRGKSSATQQGRYLHMFPNYIYNLLKAYRYQASIFFAWWILMVHSSYVFDANLMLRTRRKNLGLDIYWVKNLPKVKSTKRKNLPIIFGSVCSQISHRQLQCTAA